MGVDSVMTRPSCTSVGTTAFGFSLRYSGSCASPRRRSRWTPFQASFFAANMIKRQHLDKRINGQTYLANCLDPPGACHGPMILFVTVVGVNVRLGSIATDVARVKIHRCPLRSESNGPPSKRNLSQRAKKRHHSDQLAATPAHVRDRL
jgi:hypothetical protein